MYTACNTFLVESGVSGEYGGAAGDEGVVAILLDGVLIPVSGKSLSLSLLSGILGFSSTQNVGY